METQQITVQRRDASGKGPSRKDRAAGRIPAVMYGHKEAPVSLTFDPSDLSRCLRASGRGRNTLFELQGLDRGVTALIRELQVHPVKRDVVHVDFLEVRGDDRVRAAIPVKTTGRAAGQVAGGDLHIAMREVRVRCKAFEIPKEIVIDIAPMELGETFRVGNLELPTDVEPVDSDRLAVVAIKESRRSKQMAQTGEETAGS